MAETNPSEVAQPADDVCFWSEQNSSIMLKGMTRFGDPVERTADDARAIASVVKTLADKLDPCKRIENQIVLINDRLKGIFQTQTLPQFRLA
jgi:hypothetical protein